jgi:PAS domain S-box-containing protein
VYGTLSQSNSGRGIAFYRLMAFAIILSNVVFGSLYLFIIEGGNELIWDRVAILTFAVLVFLLGRVGKIQTPTYSLLVSVLFYVNTAHVIWTVYFNNFDGYYYLSLLFTTQACAFSFRDERSTFMYLLFVCVGTLFALFIPHDINYDLIKLFATLTIIISVLQFLSARVKCRFMSDMKMNQELLRSLISKSEDAIFLTGMNGNIFDFNSRAVELFGFERHELLDHDFKLLRKEALSGIEIENGLNELETKRFWSMESTLVKKDKKEIPVRVSITLLKSGMRKYLVYRVMDITELKENEAKIIEARDRAEEAVHAKSQFLAVMSHEIRTPLNGVIATAGMLQQTSLDSEQDEYTSTIKKSGQSLLMLINDILEFSKMENGKMLLDVQQCNLNNAIFDVVDLLRPHAESKGINLIASIDANLPKLLALDEHRLKQIFFNLIGNAIKFTEQGKVEFICECAEKNRDHVTIRFSIADSGIGIPQDKIHLLFQSFTQVDSSISRKYGGTGLGLAISKQLVELMGGKMDVKSVEGKGTTFSFYIKSKIVSADEVKKSAVSHEPEIIADFSQTKVLVCEDNEINQQVLKYILDNLRIQSDLVEDGAQALEACRSKNYDIIFMDMQMPVMDGLTATACIREQLIHQPYIVAITANTFLDDQDRCAQAGMNDFLAKPFELEDLKAVLLKWHRVSGNDVISAA